MMKVELAPDVPARFRKALRISGKQEIGGMLFAEQLAPSHFRIVDFSLDPHSGTHANFRRDPEVHRKALNEFFDKTGRNFRRYNYLGEWHSHPSFSVRPSLEDVNTMTDIVDDPQSGIAFALLLIVRLRFWCFLDHSMTAFTQGGHPQSAIVPSA